MVKVPYFSYLQVKITLYSRLSRPKNSAISADSYLNISQLSVDLHADLLDKLQWKSSIFRSFGLFEAFLSPFAKRLGEIDPRFFKPPNFSSQFPFSFDGSKSRHSTTLLNLGSLDFSRVLESYTPEQKAV